MTWQYGELRPTNGWDRSGSLRHPCIFQRLSRIGSVTARHSSIGRQPNFAALNRHRHLYSAGRPSRWVLAHSSSLICSWPEITLKVIDGHRHWPRLSHQNITTARCIALIFHYPVSYWRSANPTASIMTSVEHYPLYILSFNAHRSTSLVITNLHISSVDAMRSIY